MLMGVGCAVPCFTYLLRFGSAHKRLAALNYLATVLRPFDVAPSAFALPTFVELCSLLVALVLAACVPAVFTVWAVVAFFGVDVVTNPAQPVRVSVAIAAAAMVSSAPLAFMPLVFMRLLFLTFL